MKSVTPLAISLLNNGREKRGSDVCARLVFNQRRLPSRERESAADACVCVCVFSVIREATASRCTWSACAKYAGSVYRNAG